MFYWEGNSQSHQMIFFSKLATSFNSDFFLVIAYEGTFVYLAACLPKGEGTAVVLAASRPSVEMWSLRLVLLSVLPPSLGSPEPLIAADVSGV